MFRCPACHGEIPEDQRFCGSCGARSPSGDPDADPTIQVPPPPSAPRRAITDGRGRILPGTIIGGRYRVISLAGRGGMGEVYRADDLKLGQAVALKFLPKAVEGDTARLSHLLDEVRIARQISHPNVCRVYDVGEVDGRHFLSMEFIDGEDLASLLRRIGRLPPEKAVQIARQLCAGLAAAHDLGVLHRDLKPANVMIDGRGRARVTDFGLAGFEAKITGEDIRSGTPAYMAPEQLEGREVSVRSDIYSLGLVLYEVFAGRPAFESRSLAEAISDRRSGPPSTPASHVAGIDDAVERAILRCLEPNPPDRPASALAVASALPGGDPLAAALAAGETPSPEVVAATPTEGSLSPGRALLMLAAALTLWIGGRWVSSTLIDFHGFRRSPVSLADRSRDLLKTVGYPEEPVDRDWGYLTDEPLLLRLRATPSPDLVAVVRSGRAPLARYWYREGLSYLVPYPGLSVSPTKPSPETPGTRLIEMSPDGRLVKFRAFPPENIKLMDRATAVDWSPLFAAAELDPARFEPAPPVLMPPDFADTVLAWTGAADDLPGKRLIVEAAAWKERPVFFTVLPDTFRTARSSVPDLKSRQDFFYLLLGVLFTSIVLFGSWMARRNILNGRGDRRGAFRVAIFVFSAVFVSLLAQTSHVPTPVEFGLLFDALAQSLLPAAIAWLLYVGIEPILRRNSPRSVISWARVLSGRYRDPLVGRDMLIGALGAGVMVTLVVTFTLYRAKYPDLAISGVENLTGAGLLAVATGSAFDGFIQSMGYILLWQVLSLWLRSSRRGAVALGLILTFGLTVAFGPGLDRMVFCAVIGSWLAFFFTRFGLLASATMHSIFLLSLGFPVSFNPRTWFFGESLLAIGLGALPGLYGAWIAMARSPEGRVASRR